MQRIVIIALLSLINCAAFAQQFPSGSDDVEINLDALKPMEEGYTPPSMFGAPLTNFDDIKKQEKSAKKSKPSPKKVEYFNPAPIPPRRPDTLKASKDYLRMLTNKNTDATPSPKPKPESVDAIIYDNDMDADVLHMDAESVLNSIEGSMPEQNIETINKVRTDNSKTASVNIAHSIVFDIGEIEIPNQDRNFLANNIALSMSHNPNIRLEIQSFASPNIEEKNSRRTSLLRAINIRNFLETKGISKDRVTIKALGDKTEQTPLDRADLLFSS